MLRIVFVISLVIMALTANAEIMKKDYSQVGSNQHSSSEMGDNHSLQKRNWAYGGFRGRGYHRGYNQYYYYPYYPDYYPDYYPYYYPAYPPVSYPYY
jgi:hypothetical protein